MSISKGDRIGPYEIVGWVGAGGMGEVYRARDPRLGREVAIKLISGRFTADAGRVRRFEQEARAAGQLNHPNVLTVYDTGTHDGAPYLVSELLEGESLGARLRAGRLPPHSAIDYARQIAEGLAAAHDKHLVHRDVKPENVFVTTDGRIKILDFGIAKLTRPGDGADGRRDHHTTTDEGIVIGSSGYMSPEQVRGEPLDVRSDLFSLGAILYELLTGRPAFACATPAEAMAAILKESPTIPADVSPALARIVSRGLEKTREGRFQSARDFAFALDGLSEHDVAGTAPASAASHVTWVVVLAATAAMSLLVGVATSTRSGGAAPASVEPRTPASAADRLAEAELTPLTDWEGSEALASISPDGRFVAFLSDRDGQFDIWLSQVGSRDFRNLTPDVPSMNPPGVVLRPFGFSGDGSKIWFSRSGNPGDRKMLMPLLGGTPWTFLGDGDVTPSWSPDGARLAYVNNGNGDPMFVADGSSGADARQILAVQPGVLHNHDPAWSRDGEWIYFLRGSEPTDEMDIWRLPASGGDPERLTTLHAPVNFLAPLDARTVLYVARAADRTGPWLWALDVEARASRRVNWGLEQYTSIAASHDGRRLVATVAHPTSALWTVPILDRQADDADAQRYPMTTVRAFAPRFGGPTLFYLSASGKAGGLWRLAGGAASEIWRGVDGTLSEPPSLSPDRQKIALVISRQGKRRLTIVSADGTNARTLVAPIEMQGATGQATVDWSKDGRSLITGGSDSNGAGLFRIPVEGGAAVRLFAGQATNPVRSPDGSLILFTGAFVAGQAPLVCVDASGTVVTLPAVTVRQGGYRFLPDGSGLVYLPGLQSRDFWLLDLATGARRQLTHFTSRARVETFDITPDGKAIVFDRLQENTDIVLIDLPK